MMHIERYSPKMIGIDHEMTSSQPGNPECLGYTSPYRRNLASSLDKNRRKANMTTLLVAGAIIGFIVGLTGVGGGSLMTPFLIWYGIPAQIAVGTDLLFAAITKSSGILSHAKQNHIRWRAVAALAITSIPGSIGTLILLKTVFPNASAYADIMKFALGIMLTITGALLLLRAHKIRVTTTANADITQQQRVKLMVVGLPLGVLVTLSSVGAGVIGTMLLMLILPHIRSQDIVGSDLAHAVPLTFVAGFGHYLMLNTVDFDLLLALLLGSVPAVFIGGLCAKYVPDQVLRMSLAIGLLCIGSYYIWDYIVIEQLANAPT